MKSPWKKDERPAYIAAEKRQGKRPGARQQVSSGRTWSGLRDVVEKSKNGITLLIDNKTGKDGPLKSYRITEKEWKEFLRDANRTPPGCNPALRLDIGPYHLIVVDEATWDAAIS